MSFIKIGEDFQILQGDIKSEDFALSELDTRALDSYIEEHFKKVAAELKIIAPKAKDFLYFTAIMLHSAEAILVDDNGNIRKDAGGKNLEANWDINEKTGSWKWVCSDNSVNPYKNHNGDIFPESELKKAYKKWVGKPLCVDHKSSSVDHIRGVIVDAYYDDKFKRVIGLCALDKVTYPDLAFKINSAYSSSVSMGTGVGIVCCTTCGCTARVESQFCEHMKNKTCYGEINIDLSPIELSIVVNGADPKAKIRHIVAAANSIAQYVEAKGSLLDEQRKVMSSVEVEQLEDDLEKAHQVINKIKNSISALEKKNEVESVEPAYGQPGRGTLNMAETDLENTDKSMGIPPNARLAKDDLKDAVKEVLAEYFPQKDLVSSQIVEGPDGTEKIGKEAEVNNSSDNDKNYANNIASIQSVKNNEKDLQMTTTEKKAYWLGGGGVNEPAPKQVKYPKEDEDSIRDKEDKQMVGQMDTGPVDGVHPGYDSFPEGEEARREKLLRAELEERKMRRSAALEAAKTAVKNKSAYWLGGGGVNEPTPGKPKYPKEDADSVRDKEDKQMVGEKPFPGVGKVDGLYDDDLKKKQMLSRAKLSASFIKAAKADCSDDLDNSCWQVFADKKLILTATVKELTGDKAKFMYDTVATKEFGKKLLTAVKHEGVEGTMALIKGAQMPAVTEPAAAPAGPVDAGMPAEMLGKPEEDVMDKGDVGSPMEQVENQLQEMDNLVSDMKQSVEALEHEDTTDLAALEPANASEDSVSLPEMRKTLNASLQKGVKQAVAELEEHVEELNLIKHVYANSVNEENVELVSNITEQALEEAQKSVANVRLIQSAFVKYARGTDILLKKAAEVTSELVKQADHCSEDDDAKLDKMLEKNDADDPGVASDPSDSWMKALDSLKDVEKRVEKDLLSGKDPQRVTPGAGMKGDKVPEAPKSDLKDVVPPTAVPAPAPLADDANYAVDFKMNPDGSLEGSADKLEELKAGLDLTTKEGRAKMREKLAQKGVSFSDILGKAHPSGGTTTKLDVKPEGDLAKVEDLEEVHNKVMEVATAAPRKVREAAEQIEKLVKSGKIDPKSDFTMLVANGLDAEAVKYWKQFYGEAKDGGAQFAAELVKDYDGKKKAEEMAQYRVKVARAYELAHDMADRNMIGNTREAINQQVQDMLGWEDSNFESVKKIVSRASVVKQASLPLVGQGDIPLEPEIVIPAARASVSELSAQLETAFSKKRY